ncbi:hypothetical protein [Reinekea blandensis]|nr:hypothetical protein [Reinekea blandensis]
MTFKHQLFQRLQPFARHYALFKWLSLAQAIGTVLLPLIMPDIETALWMLSLALLAFWLSNYALLRMAHHYQADRKGLLAWVNNLWENLLVISWAVLLVSIIYLVIKLVLYLSGQP